MYLFIDLNPNLYIYFQKMTDLKCSVFMCNKTKKDGVSLHEFPEHYTQPWIIAVDLGPTWIPKHTSRICSDHFHVVKLKISFDFSCFLL